MVGRRDSNPLKYFYYATRELPGRRYGIIKKHLTEDVSND
jgi:hypothetical protein